MNLQTWTRRIRKLQSHPRPGRLLLARALWHSHVSPLLTIPLGDGLRVRFFGSSISAALWVSADARNEDVDFLKAVLRQGDSYVDCGANIGHLAIIARSAVGSSGRITAIEPNPRIFSFCTRNLSDNQFQDVLAINVALGNAHGVARISDRTDDDQNRVGDSEGVEVPLRPLDEVIGDAPVTLLKLDVEGYELQVLKGGKRTLQKTDVVYCELSTSNCARFGYAPDDVEQLLLDEGFVLVKRSPAGYHAVNGPLYRNLPEGEQPATGYNLIAVKPRFMPQFARRVREHGALFESASVDAC